IADTVNHRIRKLSTLGIITTVAGNGIHAYSGDAGPATNASLNNPAGVAVDAGGNLYIADLGNQCIRKVALNGIITTIAGSGFVGGSFAGDGGPAIFARLNSPTGVAVDAATNVYVADYANHRVRKIAPNGIITTFAGNGVNTFGGDGGAAT